ncbi:MULTISPECIES: type VI secretion system baseplate subunit TssE [Chromobacterium]|jgi:type VI secretion system protein ImpF|uniref:Type VI secretion protein n=2 Tax=Chromobacterium TaxID=535 RepID=A0A2S9X8I7_9NEIS|nr:MULTISPECIES: type VI secretion system baseplate subunit TssE [Chromobacterium]MBM2885261.1 type VI secretion system baseplate subunit TssE [Chromobacterium amazonense]MDE1713148.1 type VI secretion system baseplate subunit TssE [Chromobacterium amazonense]MDQ4541120.1 type VI secretion system baseplate subunit TssE [Chromobacterium amazonense]POA98468.1 type VI secretion system baseplate subunit TssE [Chromobacterium sinusclupearum]PRP72032.1 type VI secretion protein [Chromobacterium amaz
MSGNRHALILPSVLDRLLDDEPDQSHIEPISLFELSHFKQSLARDLEALLNTRLMPLDPLDPFPQARDSLLSYGIPDLSGISLLNPDDRELLREQLRRSIELHEPRLSRVRVSLDAPREMERHLRFRVDAVLKVHPHKPPVTFDATLQLSSNVYKVQG